MAGDGAGLEGRPAPISVTCGAGGCASTCASAWSRSAMISSGSSRPTDMRIIPSVMPAASRASRGIMVWVMAAACSTSVSVSPRISPWPPMYLVRLWMTTSAPNSSGRVL